MPDLPCPDTTVAIVLGASDFTKAGLASDESFARSAEAFSEYLVSDRRLALNQHNVCNLFDSDANASAVVEAVDDFLNARVTHLGKKGKKVQDILVYYTGHGEFRNGEFGLALRRTSSLAGSLLLARFLSEVLLERMRFARRYIILDCCFASAAYKAFMSAPTAVAAAQLPSRGTALLCAAAQDRPALTKVNRRDTRTGLTVFTDALLEVLDRGVEEVEHEYLTLGEVGTGVEALLRQNYEGQAPRPELKSPDEREGDPARVRLFPNNGHVPVLPCQDELGTTLGESMAGFGFQPAGAAYDPNWYMEHESEEAASLSYLGQAGKPTILWAPSKFGKTWCLSHVLREFQRCQSTPVEVALLDLRTLPYDNLERLLRAMADRIAMRVKPLRRAVSGVWECPSDGMGKLTVFLEDHALREFRGIVVLALDGADAVLGKPYQDDFCALLRFFCEQAAASVHDHGQRRPWWRFRLILTVSTRPALLSTDIRFSVFEGLSEPIPLDSFTVDQVQRLSSLYRVVATRAEIGELHKFVGGHPYLVRLALDHAATHGSPLDEVVRASPTTSPFRHHIQNLRRRLRKRPDLYQAFREVLCNEYQDRHEDLYESLASAGCVAQDPNGHLVPFAPLYAKLL